MGSATKKTIGQKSWYKINSNDESGKLEGYVLFVSDANIGIHVNLGMLPSKVVMLF